MAARITGFIVVAIVGITVIAGLIVGAQRDDNGPVDLIVFNGKVYVGADDAFAEAVAIRGNQILRVGSNREIKRLRRLQTTVVDAHGGAVLPGFNDAHLRLTAGTGQLDTEPSREERRQSIAATIREAHRQGITSVQEAAGTPEDLELLGELRGAGALPLRVYYSLAVSPDLSEEEADELDDLRARFPDDPVLKTGAVTLAAGDFVPEPGDARPPRRGPEAGAAQDSGDALSRVVTMMDARGWQVAIQAAGEAVIRLALDAFEQAAEENPEPVRGRRHRIEPAEALHGTDAARAARLGVVTCLHPAASDARLPEPAAVDARADVDRSASWARTWNAVAEAAGSLAFGTEWPAGPMSPLVGIESAVTAPVTQDDAGNPLETSVPLADAIDAYTSGAAYAAFDELRKGTIAAGMLADLVILSTDIFTLPPERLREAVVIVTIFDGRVVYNRELEETEP
jgi:predicted amidohydrolase YtcJ